MKVMLLQKLYLNILRTSRVWTRRFSAQKQVKNDDFKESVPSYGKPFHAIPGPRKSEMFIGFLPGGRLHNKSLLEVYSQWRHDFGDIFRMPALFGKRDIVVTFQPNDYQTVFRTEGSQPIRKGLDIVQYYRKVHRPEIFKHAAGLVAEQGDGWAHFRSTVNPVMMNPKTTKLYAPKMSKVADAFLELIQQKRDPSTNEMPDNFESYINYWAMDSVCLVALDTDLGMIRNSAAQPRAKAIIDGMREFFELLLELDLKPSLWKYVATPDFRRVIRTFDELTDTTIYYIDEAIKRDVANRSNVEESVLQRLFSIDRIVAIVMAMDLVMGGLDNSTSALTSCLLSLAKNPEKQSVLRKEVYNNNISEEALQSSTYLRACIKEAFRMYPVSTGNFRTTGQNVVLSGYHVPKGVDIAMPGQLLQFDEKYYERPNEYLPERWLRDGSHLDSTGCPLNKNVPFVYIPFGFGPRICIGKRFLALQLEITITKLIQNFEIAFDYPTEGMFKTNIINVPAKPLRFKFTDVKE